MSSTSTALATDDEREHLGTGQQPLAAAQEPPLASAQVQELLEAAQEQPLETEHQQEPSTRTQEQNLEQEQVREQEADGSLLRGPRRTRESVIPLRVFLAILASLPRLQVGVWTYRIVFRRRRYRPLASIHYPAFRRLRTLALRDAEFDPLQYLRFYSSASGAEQITLGQYIDRMREGQRHINYIMGDSREDLDQDDLIADYRTHRIEVLFVLDHEDKIQMRQLGWCYGYPLNDLRPQAAYAKYMHGR